MPLIIVPVSYCINLSMGRVYLSIAVSVMFRELDSNFKNKKR